MNSKVLLLHGPIQSIGINFLTSQLHAAPEDRNRVSAAFSAAENIRSLSHVFRGRGYKVVYSGWSEDQAWITQHQSLFDAYCINDQKELPDSVEFQGRLIQNNKEKLYFSLYQGLREIESVMGQDCTVVRLRSDVAVDVKEIDKLVLTCFNYPQSILVEFANPDNVLFVPDFITIADLATHSKLYRNLSRLCRQSGGHHISSHIDHGIEFLRMREQSELSQVICMTRALHDAMVWRGLPRYYAQTDGDPSEKLLFNCLINYPPGMNFEAMLKSLHPNLAGRPGALTQAVSAE
jgi:hypothetical protein